MAASNSDHTAPAGRSNSAAGSPIPFRRRWFRFSLRTLFLLVTVFGVWLGVQVKWIQDRHEAQQWIESRGGVFVTEGGHFRVDLLDGSAEGSGIRIFNHPKAPWSIRLIGADTVYWMVVPGNGDDQLMDIKMQELRKLFPEADVRTNDPTHQPWPSGRLQQMNVR